MPVDPTVSKNDAYLVFVLALLVEKYLQAVANTSSLLALHFGFATQHVHPVDLQLNWIESYRMWKWDR
jgi:hypothetical protein